MTDDIGPTMFRHNLSSGAGDYSWRRTILAKARPCDYDRTRYELPRRWKDREWLKPLPRRPMAPW
jgi:hypothetical protein